ncbi:MAG: hypothetical protein ABEN55_19445 [Bradymonadaceae bacterium]
MYIWIATLLCLAAVGCDPNAPTGGGESVPEGCPDTGGPFVRGRVLVPDLGGTENRKTEDGGAEDGAASGATASEERREVPARDVSVTLTGGGGEATTRTDAKGRWCLDLGDREPGMDLVARATVGGTTLRRPVITREGQIISVRSEAVLRILEQKLDDPSTVPPAAFLNLEAVVSTATDLLNPVNWRGAESIDAVVATIVDRIAEDPRFANTLKTLKARKKE